MTGKVRSQYKDVAGKDQKLDRKLGASCLEELGLKKALSEAHAESERLRTCSSNDRESTINYSLILNITGFNV